MVSQTVNLPAGTYKLTFDTYTAQNISNGASRCGYAIDGEATYAPLPAIGAWNNEVMSFELTEAKDVTFSFGYNKAKDAGGGSSPILYVDNVKLYSVEVPTFTYNWLPIDVTSQIANPNFAENEKTG